MGFVWDWISEGWNFISGVVNVVFDLIGEVVGKILAPVIDWLVDAIAYVLPGFDDVFDGLINMFAGIYDELGGTSDVIVDLIASWIGPYGALLEAAESAWHEIVDELHEEIVNEVNIQVEHNRDDMQEINFGLYTELIKLSKAMEDDPNVLLLAIRDMKWSVLDVGATLGRPYNVCELEWFSVFVDILKLVGGDAGKFKGRLPLLFQEMDELVSRHRYDAKAGLLSNLYAVADENIKGLSDVFKQVESVQKAIEDIVKRLPDFATKGLEDAINKVKAVVDKFIGVTYPNDKNTADGWFEDLYNKYGVIDEKVGDLGEIVDNPGDLLERVDLLGDVDRMIQEEKIADIATRIFTYSVDAWRDAVSPGDARLRKAVEAYQKKRLPPKWYVKEMEGPTKPFEMQSGKRDTWFVGDY